MRFGIKPMFRASDLTREIGEDIQRQQLQNFIAIADDVVKKARARWNADKVYQNRTGNLESSVGYIIFRDGRVLHEDFQYASSGTDKATGVETGRREAKAEYRLSQGWNIVFVAGMEYASWLESRGFGVLTPSMSNFEKYMEESIKNVNHG